MKCWVTTLCRLALMTVITATPVVAGDLPIRHGLYQLKAELLLPNLEHNLRYTTTDSCLCYNGQNVVQLFPILSNVSCYRLPACTGS